MAHLDFMADLDFLTEARHQAAQCWCDEDTSSITMDPRIAEAIAQRIASWMGDAAQYARNAQFYRELLVRCSAHLGRDVYVSDDGSVQAEPLLIKVPELVASLAERCARAEGNCDPNIFDGLDRIEAARPAQAGTNEADDASL